MALAVAEPPVQTRKRAPSTSSEKLDHARALDEEIRRLHQRSNRDLALMARRLFELGTSRGYLALGFPSLAAYAKKVLGWGSSKVRDLMTLMRRLPDQPDLANEFCAGEIGWTLAVEVSRAMAKLPGQEGKLMERAQQGVSAAQLRCEVAEERGEQARTSCRLDLSLGALAWSTRTTGGCVSRGSRGPWGTRSSCW